MPTLREHQTRVKELILDMTNDLLEGGEVQYSTIETLKSRLSDMIIMIGRDGVSKWTHSLFDPPRLGRSDDGTCRKSPERDQSDIGSVGSRGSARSTTPGDLPPPS